jgi:hypothetical protein
VNDWFSLDTAIVDVLARQPTALSEARKAPPFHTAALIASVGSFVFLTKTMVTTVSHIDDPTAENVESVKSDYIFILGLTTGSIVFDQIALRYIRRGVSIFNVGETNPSGQHDSPSLFQQLVRNFSLSPTLLPGNGAGFTVQTRLGLR